LDLNRKNARHLKRNQLPFGGMQVILCGDFFQLPPVSVWRKKNRIFIQIGNLEKIEFKNLLFEEQFRHKDDKFIKNFKWNFVE